MSVAPKRAKWAGSDLAGFVALMAKLGCDNVDVVLNLETGILWVYGPGESEAKGGGTPFNYVHFCPPAPIEFCET